MKKFLAVFAGIIFGAIALLFLIVSFAADTVVIGIILAFLCVIPSAILIKNANIITKKPPQPQIQTQSVTNIQSSQLHKSLLEIELEKVDAMTTNGWAFERYTAELLLRNGFDKAYTTSGSNDYGVDVIAEKDSIKYAIQCKCYSNKLNNKPVQEVIAGMNYYHTHVGVVFTNNYFTENAKNLASSSNVLLWDREKLKELINNSINNS